MARSSKGPPHTQSHRLAVVGPKVRRSSGNAVRPIRSAPDRLRLPIPNGLGPAQSLQPRVHLVCADQGAAPGLKDRNPSDLDLTVEKGTGDPHHSAELVHGQGGSRGVRGHRQTFAVAFGGSELNPLSQACQGRSSYGGEPLSSPLLPRRRPVAAAMAHPAPCDDRMRVAGIRGQPRSERLEFSSWSLRHAPGSRCAGRGMHRSGCGDAAPVPPCPRGQSGARGRLYGDGRDSAHAERPGESLRHPPLDRGRGSGVRRVTHFHR
jgi:hypothetical protein